MVTSIVRQSIIIKCNQQAATLLGNYELYYAAGLAKKLFSLNINEDMEPTELCDALQQTLGQAEPKDEKEGYLVKLLSNCAATEAYDLQMKELFLMGVNENHLWQMNI